MTDPLDPAAASLLDRLAEGAIDQATLDDATWIARYRAQLAGFTRFQPVPAAEVSIEIRSIPHGPSIRLYMPGDVQGTRPALLWCHGGGFIGGHLDAYDRPLSHLAARSGWLIAAVEYRLAPEHPHPAARDDCATGLDWLRDTLGAPVVGVGGDSCGGLIATWVSRDAQALVAVYPNADLRPCADFPSRAEHDGKVVKLAELDRGLAMYLHAADPSDPALSPALADTLPVPPTLLVTCARDPLRDEGTAMGAAMRRAGATITEIQLPDMIHGVLQFSAAIPAGETLIDQIATWLRGISAPSDQR